MSLPVFFCKKFLHLFFLLLLISVFKVVFKVASLPIIFSSLLERSRSSPAMSHLSISLAWLHAVWLRAILYPISILVSVFDLLCKLLLGIAKDLPYSAVLLRDSCTQYFIDSPVPPPLRCVSDILLVFLFVCLEHTENSTAALWLP